MISSAGPSTLERTRPLLSGVIEQAGLHDATVSVLARPLTPEQAIGTPGRRDFPILVGKERVIEATLLYARGHAFTDAPREFEGTLEQVLALELSTNAERAIYVATLNAVLSKLDMARGTVHCRDDDPERCGREIAARLQREHGPVRVGLVGLNPAIAAHLCEAFGPERVAITDLNPDNIGTTHFGVVVQHGRDSAERLVDASDVVLLTGTTLVNGSFDGIWNRVQQQHKRGHIYGVTAAGVAALLGLERLCPYGRDG